MLGDQFADEREEGGGDLDHGMPRIIERGLVFGHGREVGLLFIMGDHLAHPLFIPALWKFFLFHIKFLFRFLRRKAASGFPFNS